MTDHNEIDVKSLRMALAKFASDGVKSLDDDQLVTISLILDDEIQRRSDEFEKNEDLEAQE